MLRNSVSFVLHLYLSLGLVGGMVIAAGITMKGVVYIMAMLRDGHTTHLAPLSVDSSVVKAWHPTLSNCVIMASDTCIDCAVNDVHRCRRKGIMSSPVDRSVAQAGGH